MIKYWRILLVAVMVFASLMAIGYGPPKKGVEVIYVGSGSPAAGLIEQGMIVTQVNSRPVNSLNEWNDATENLGGEARVVADGKEYVLDLNSTNIGISVIDLQRLNLDFGLDLRGGTRITLVPKENATKDVVDEVVATLQTRANIYGLREIRFYSVSGGDGRYYVQIEATGVGRDIVDNLLSKQGMFEAKVMKPVQISEGSGIIELGTRKYDVSYVGNETISINGSMIRVNGTFTLENIRFELMNATSTRVVLLASVYDGNDIEFVKTDPQNSGIYPRGGGYQFYFAVLVSENGARKFADVTTGIPSYVDLNSGERYLDSRIFLYLDGQLVSDLSIGANLGGVVYTTPQIQGMRPTMEEAVQEKLNLQSILRSGALPTTLETSSVQVIAPTLGSDFFYSAGLTGLVAAVMVAGVVFIKYRKLKISIPITVIGLSEIIIIMGVAAENDAWIWGTVLVLNFMIILTAWWKKAEVDISSWIGAVLIPLLGMTSWTIDLPAIAGVIAAIGTGANDQIIIADEALRGEKGVKKIYSMKEKVKQAFFIVFGSAATIIAAMIPLMSIGIGMVRGFAITTVIGVLIGVLVTRPAYAKIVELAVKD